MKKYRDPYRRIQLAVMTQFSLFPTIGIVWNVRVYKFRICFLWLCFGVSVGCFKEEENETD